jgi:hypothetical protein
MGFLKKLFGESKSKQSTPQSVPYTDTQGIYFFVQCDNCGTPVRVRADKQHDLLDEGDGYAWHKTIVDSRCFRRMPTIVHLNRQYEVVSQTIEGGRYISEETYKSLLSEAQGSRGAEEQGRN